MLLPFGTRSIFRNRWIALAWAGGVVLMASEIVDSVSGVAGGSPDRAAPATSRKDAEDPVAVALGNAPPAGPASASPAAVAAPEVPDIAR